MHKINKTADMVIKLAGSAKKLADHLGIKVRWVQKWNQPRDKGGANGNIPSKHHRAILFLAEREGWKLTAEDLLIND